MSSDSGFEILGVFQLYEEATDFANSLEGKDRENVWIDAHPFEQSYIFIVYKNIFKKT